MYVEFIKVVTRLQSLAWNEIHLKIFNATKMYIHRHIYMYIHAYIYAYTHICVQWSWYLSHKSYQANMGKLINDNCNIMQIEFKNTSTMIEVIQTMLIYKMNFTNAFGTWNYQEECLRSIWQMRLRVNQNWDALFTIETT